MLAMKDFARKSSLLSMLIAAANACSGGDPDSSGAGGTPSVGGTGQAAGVSSTTAAGAGAGTAGKSSLSATSATGGREPAGTGGAHAEGGTAATASGTATGVTSVAGGTSLNGTATTGGQPPNGGASATGGGTSAGGTNSNSTTTTGGQPPNGGASTAGGVTSTSSMATTGGTTAAGGTATTTGGTTAAGGMGTLATGGALAVAGQSATGGSSATGGATGGGSTPVARVTGNWRFTIADTGAGIPPFTGYVALAQSTANGTIEGHAIDRDGLADVRGTYDASLGKINFIKSYVSGTSKDLEFDYVGTLVNPSGPITGTWSGENASDVWSATFVSGYSPSAAAGTWNMLANWGTGTFTLAITGEGYVTGTMTDTNGSSNLEGVLDLGDGSLFFRKVYTSGSMFWYYGSMNAAGTQITSGTWGNTSAALTAGTWTAGR
jgi:hypothetical protein